VNSVADEAYSVQFFDGAGRTILAGGNHPGSTGGNRLVNSIYDRMGRLVKQSNPTETNGDRVPVGDDSAGWFIRSKLTIGKAGRWRPPPDGWDDKVSELFSLWLRRRRGCNAYG